MDDPRRWDIATATAHLKSVGLTGPSQCTPDAGPGVAVEWQHWAGARGRLFHRVGFTVFYFTSTWDTRTVPIALAMPPSARSELCAIGAHKGSVALLWWRRIPTGYERDSGIATPDGDWWVIAASEVVDPSSPDSYDAYLASDIWRRTRALALEHYGAACALCGATERLNVHHRTYATVGSERLADLTVLCRGCHARYHGKVA